jgi:predicted Fe-Mo cluster-binding NifX family protein
MADYNQEKIRRIPCGYVSSCNTKRGKICMELTIAFSTDDGNSFNNDHFGMAQYFLIYEFSDEKEEIIETRKNAKYAEDTSRKHGDPGKAKATSSVLDGVDVIAGRKFGPNIVRLLKNLYVLQ